VLPALWVTAEARLREKLLVIRILGSSKYHLHDKPTESDDLNEHSAFSEVQQLEVLITPAVLVYDTLTRLNSHKAISNISQIKLC
jgi:hypothetical protein